MKRIFKTMINFSLMVASTTLFADITVPIHLTSNNKLIGTITLKDTLQGLQLSPHLKNLAPGEHGFHVHAMPSCDNHGEGAGGHLDPDKTGKHLGPYNPEGHLGDLPVLKVDTKGEANEPVIAPRLKLKEVVGHTLMIHEGGDNYSDAPKKLGGGGSRVACGVVS